MSEAERALRIRLASLNAAVYQEKGRRKERTVSWSGRGPVIICGGSFPCWLMPVSLGSPRASSSLVVPQCLLGADAVTILELLDGPRCRKLPLSQASSWIGFCGLSPEGPGFQKHLVRHRRGLHSHSLLLTYPEARDILIHLSVT